MKMASVAACLAVWSATAFSATDSAVLLFERGIADWDSAAIHAAYFRSIKEQPAADFLFKATCWWRLQIIAYLSDDKKGVARRGIRALELLDSAKLIKENTYLVTARRAYVSQLMAGTSLKNGPVFGQRTAKYLDEMKKMKPDGFHTQFINAVNLLEMPSFVGGDPKKARELLLELHQKYPDSAAVAISLARAMIKNKQKEEARKVLDQVLKKEPKNRWAKKVKGEIK